MIVMMLMRCARHVFVIMRARLAGHSRCRNRVRDGGARQKCQRAHQQQKFRRQPPHAAKASTAGRPGQGPLYNQSAKERRADSRFLFSGVNTLVSPYRIDANPNRHFTVLTTYRVIGNGDSFAAAGGAMA